MEETVKEVKEQQAAVVSGKSKLRYPLRSATKAKEEKPLVAELSNSSASKRGKPASSVSKSMGVLDLSGKTNLPSRPEGCLFLPSQWTASRKRFNTLASASYWLSQIKLSESAVKHSISLGFFKLALEAGCEPLQRMRDELKSYVQRHDHELGEIGESVKELFESYGIADNQEQVQVSESCSQVPEEGTRSSDDEVLSSSSMGNRKLTPRSLNADAAQASKVTESAKKVTQKNTTAPRSRASQNKNTANSRSVSGTAGQKLQRKPQRPGKDKIKQGKKSATEEGPISPPANGDTPEENKENLDAPPMEISLTEIS
ncbi:hypothetical protein GH714_040778 [Hevea brasiliensis]|uniref:Uncharacterized protein n=1 Tax=Hevea brasiliensis TaxID=3981 RepID=A0A6A6MUZ1_HEVBR|nr:hypothetical protein GH714_040778 [Hevea brasiliensis]